MNPLNSSLHGIHASLKNDLPDKHGYYWKYGEWLLVPSGRKLAPPHDPQFKSHAERAGVKFLVSGRGNAHSNYSCYLILPTTDRGQAIEMFDYLSGVEWRSEKYRPRIICLYNYSVRGIRNIKNCVFKDHSSVILKTSKSN